MAIDTASIISAIVGLFGGGVIGVIIKALIEKKKINAEATDTSIRSLLEIDQRMNERMAKLEERVADLERENYKLKTENISLEKESYKLKSKITELKEEIERLRAENEELKINLEKYTKKKGEN